METTCHLEVEASRDALKALIFWP